jgi:hypothetical protein
MLIPLAHGAGRALPRSPLKALHATEFTKSEMQCSIRWTAAAHLEEFKVNGSLFEMQTGEFAPPENAMTTIIVEPVGIADRS